MNIILRKACLEDSEKLLAWRNEPTTIPWMGSARKLSVEEHHHWFIKSLNDAYCLFFIIEVNSEPAGQIRYHKNSEIMDDAAKVSINLTHKMHGKGIASIAFKKGSDLVRTLQFAQNIFAYVRLDNTGSIKAMENAGYERANTVEIHGIEHLIMIDRKKQEI
ncbi:MAG TPA: GNAT family N-acetyltransferase [Gammaproteobacteria bacterium]|nr:GNAT family N-acetyltransferase [Gammaproteobacteria bacterium]